MKVLGNFARLSEVLDTLLRMKKNQIYPFNRTDATVPQTLIGEDIRSDKRALSLFYFFACIYMRGGIVSSTAFKLLLRMRAKHPWMFEPAEASLREVAEVELVLRRFIGWDAKNAAIYWHANACLLVKNWRSNPLNLIEETRDYEDALHFYVNKNKKGSRKPTSATEILTHDERSVGFWGHQHKMASMQVYFADWERLYPKRFPYPGPVDFHNYRLLITTGAFRIETNVKSVSFGEKYSKPMREGLMRYITTRGVDPIDVADVLWLFSLLMCGESPHTVTRELKKKEGAPPSLFDASGVRESWDVSEWSQGKSEALDRTCHVCVFNRTCKYAIPAAPYYGKRKTGRKDGSEEKGGKLVLRERPPLWFYLTPQHIDPKLLNAPLTGEAKTFNAFPQVERPKEVHKL